MYLLHKNIQIIWKYQFIVTGISIDLQFAKVHMSFSIHSDDYRSCVIQA